MSRPPHDASSRGPVEDPLRSSPDVRAETSPTSDTRSLRTLAPAPPPSRSAYLVRLNVRPARHEQRRLPNALDRSRTHLRQSPSAAARYAPSQAPPRRAALGSRAGPGGHPKGRELRGRAVRRDQFMTYRAENWGSQGSRTACRGSSRELRQSPDSRCDLGFRVERVTRIELALSAWEADVLPLNYTRRWAELTRRPGPGDGPGCTRPDESALIRFPSPRHRLW
jgi:hypothetical protein